MTPQERERRLYWDLPRRELTEDEIEEIRDKLVEGWTGPVMGKWARQLLIDREERMKQAPSRS